MSTWGLWLPLWPWVSDSLVFERQPRTWQALLCWPGPLLACGMCPHPLLLMVAQLSPPCGFLVLILSGAMDSTLGILKVLQLPEPTRGSETHCPGRSLGVYKSRWHRADWHSPMFSDILGTLLGPPAACLPYSRPSSDLAPSFLLHLSSGAILSKVGDPLCSALAFSSLNTLKYSLCSNLVRPNL